MAKNSKQWRYWDAWTNLYKLHTTWISIGTTNQNFVFFFFHHRFQLQCQLLHKLFVHMKMFDPKTIIIPCHQKMWVPSGWCNLYPITKLLVAHEIINTRHLKQVKNQILVHWFKDEPYFITCEVQRICSRVWSNFAHAKPIERISIKGRTSCDALW
jgi:hypothetical protein